jgi:hypothetical protein
MSALKIKTGLFFTALTVAIIWLVSPDKEAEARMKYLHSLNFKITGIVEEVMPLRDQDHGYGAIYLQSFISNKGNEYECSYKNRCLFCKIRTIKLLCNALISQINPGDSVAFNTNTLMCQVYEKGKLIAETGIAINKNDSFYNVLNINGYLDFSYYHKR